MTRTKHGFEGELPRFGHPLALLPFVVVVEGVMLFYGGYLIFRAPDVISPKGILFLCLWGVSNFWLCDMVPKLWRTRSTFIVSSSHLIVVDQIRRMRCEIPWGSIVAVERIPLFWWPRAASGLLLNRIVLANHKHVFFGTHLAHYSVFVDALKRRATKCQTLDPYPTGIGE